MLAVEVAGGKPVVQMDIAEFDAASAKAGITPQDASDGDIKALES
jgi:hypothetical protein